jgi:hypothetical protein
MTIQQLSIDIMVYIRELRRELYDIKKDYVSNMVIIAKTRRGRSRSVTNVSMDEVTEWPRRPRVSTGSGRAIHHLGDVVMMGMYIL